MFYSVRARLTIWYTAILALVLITFSGITYFVLAREIRESSDASLAGTAQEFAAAFAKENHSTTREALVDVRYSDRDLMLFAPDGRLVASSRSQLKKEDRDEVLQQVRHGLNGFANTQGGEEDDGIRVFAMPINVGGQHFKVVVAHDLDEQADRLEHVAHALFLAIPLALVFAAGGGYLLARKSLAPVTTMSLKARQIGAETLTERISVANERDELGFLATTLNELLGRLQRSFESQRSFMADASHELRTPLAIIQGEADVVLSRQDRTASEYRESISVIQTAARKLTRIVESLFLLARSDAGRYPITRSRFYLDEMLGDSVRAMRSVATSRNVELTCSAPHELLMVADEALLNRMLLNLIDNALKFTPAGGHVRVEAERLDQHYAIRVIDSGIGITKSDQERIFERFYRSEPRLAPRVSPSGVSTGARGLGLPIARWIAEVHGGELWLEMSDATGSTFVAIIPQGEVEVSDAQPAAVSSSLI